ncbi:hypothetical protein D910_02950 [Dendroctonus ponderosae]|uniref:ADAMTS cysteine-rich domain-containing protein n=1 Tax=Dendroctonus ponderosae TaxID=77166 RepID=U4U4K6_DENPD|nr:hypothetical protein D910_02950 [Dendroctonus ponderosae]
MIQVTCDLYMTSWTHCMRKHQAHEKTQPCPDTLQDFRDEQCAAFDKVPYEGALYRWQPFYNDDDPCALTCKGRPQEGHVEDLLIVATLKKKVHDGTRCRPGSLDMCIAGFCQFN